ncbi:unnamed protein product, partial [Brassica rapa subsp. narinosa]
MILKLHGRCPYPSSTTHKHFLPGNKEKSQKKKTAHHHISSAFLSFIRINKQKDIQS